MSHRDFGNAIVYYAKLLTDKKEIGGLYTPTHCQDRNLGFLRWTHHHVLKPLERRKPGGGIL